LWGNWLSGCDHGVFEGVSRVDRPGRQKMIPACESEELVDIEREDTQ
jgi:hypothetical protein